MVSLTGKRFSFAQTTSTSVRVSPSLEPESETPEKNILHVVRLFGPIARTAIT
jgi:hypothetical protein